MNIWNVIFSSVQQKNNWQDFRRAERVKIEGEKKRKTNYKMICKLREYTRICDGGRHTVVRILKICLNNKALLADL